MFGRQREHARRLARRVFNAQTRRPWTAAALGGAIFTPLFWLGVALGLGRVSVAKGETAGAYPGAVLALYFAAVLVVGPALAHTGGFLLDRYTSRWRRDDAVAAFAGLGVLLAVGAITVLVGTGPGSEAFAPALWLFGVPLVLTLALTRYLIDGVLASRAWTIAAASVAFAPSAVAALLLLGLFVSRGAESLPSA